MNQDQSLRFSNSGSTLFVVENPKCNFFLTNALEKIWISLSFPAEIIIKSKKKLRLPVINLTIYMWEIKKKKLKYYKKNQINSFAGKNVSKCIFQYYYFHKSLSKLKLFLLLNFGIINFQIKYLIFHFERFS